MGKIEGATKIAGDFTVTDWKALRLRLLGEDSENRAAWQGAFNILQKRVETRFLKPINRVLSIQRFEGEGFAATALQCILIEFLEAFYQGKKYSPPIPDEEIERRAEKYGIPIETLRRHLQPHEYRSSAKLFRDFLTGREPFRKEFNSGLANNFYANIRCGLLHEAATKGDSKIRSQHGTSLIQPLPGGDLVIFRTNFQNAIDAFISIYREELPSSEILKEAFIRKMDDLSQIRRVQYFAYGSNMNLRQMKDRVGHIYDKSTGFIRNFSFRYNKKSKDGTSKANIEAKGDELTYGVCFEIDEDAFSKLRKIEKDYTEIEIPFYPEKGSMVIVKSFISTLISDAEPDKIYVRTIVRGARKNDIPKEYISRVLTFRFN